MEKLVFIRKNENHSMDFCSSQKHRKAPDLITTPNNAEKDSPELCVTKNHPKPNASSELKAEKSFWITTFNGAQFLFRECTVILILVETVILLLGYCVLLGMHLVFRNGYLFVRGKSNSEDKPDFNEDRLLNQQLQEVYYQPVALPRGRMSRG